MEQVTTGRAPEQEACKEACSARTAHPDSGSSAAVVHEGQLAKGSSLFVLEQQLLIIPRALHSLKDPTLYHVQIVTFLSLPAACSSLSCLGPAAACLLRATLQFAASVGVLKPEKFHGICLKRYPRLCCCCFDKVIGYVDDLMMISSGCTSRLDMAAMTSLVCSSSRPAW